MVWQNSIGSFYLTNKSYLLLRESDQGGVNNLHSSKRFMLHNKEQIIDSSRERGRCVMVRGRGLIHQDLNTKDNTDSPTPPATWTGAAKVDMSKEGWKDRLEEKAMADFLEANGMDKDLATTVASTTNAKIKAKKAKKEEKTKAIESTAQTALAVWTTA